MYFTAFFPYSAWPKFFKWNQVKYIASSSVFYKADTNIETFICNVCSLLFALFCIKYGIVKQAFRNLVKITAISTTSLKIIES